MWKMDMKKHRLIKIIIVFVLLVGLALAFPFSRSLAVMSVISATEQRDSVLKDEDIRIHLPGGLTTPKKDWYPFVITFNADYFGAYVNRPVDLTILYNFGAFNPAASCSAFYDPDSDYFDAFYGAYVIKSHDGRCFGYNGGELDVDEMSQVFEYDMNVLVLQSLGCPSPEFSYLLTGLGRTDIDGRVYDVVDAEISTQSPLHTVTGFQSAYFQYGSPQRYFTQKDFKNASVYGRIYASELPDQDVTLCFYIIAPNQETIDSCEADMIAQAKVILK
jgi:hypothetical protein